MLLAIHLFNFFSNSFMSNLCVVRLVKKYPWLAYVPWPTALLRKCIRDTRCGLAWFCGVRFVIVLALSIVLTTSIPIYTRSGAAKYDDGKNELYVGIAVPVWLFFGRYIIAWLALSVCEHEETPYEDIDLVDDNEEPKFDCQPWLPFHWNARHVAFSFFYQSYHLYEKGPKISNSNN